MSESPSLWPYLIPALPGFVLAAGTALGVWWNRRGVAATADLTIVQIDVARATVGKTEAEAIKVKAEAESMAVASLAKALEVADRTVDRLRAERDAADFRVGQLLQDRQDLKDELEHVTGLLKAAEEQLGLKVRREGIE